MPDYEVEVLVDADVTIGEDQEAGFDVIVEVGDSMMVGEVPDFTTVEVFDTVPDSTAYIEPVEFTRQGSLVPMTGSSELPIGPGLFNIYSISARVSVPPAGDPIILDVKQNGNSVFLDPMQRPTITDGNKIAAVGTWNNVLFEENDWLSVDIDQVGSIAPGANLVVSIRLCKLG